ncbi:MAG: hemolysin III family protein [Candidatus Hydrogenedentes bacterium]|nr:hemolysin III family protein [Candidatus Hydrogenedentota bacterium]
MADEDTRDPRLVAYSPGEEVANSVTHGIGAGLSIAGLSVLVSLAAVRGDAWRVVSFSVYGSTLVMLYLASTFYHSFRSPRVKRVLRVIDHASIYLLIAGTYTPFTLVCLRGAWGWSVFGIMWGLALIGVVSKVFLIGRFRILSVAVYVAMGWFVVLVLKPTLAAVPAGGIAWLVAGGCAYTFGVVFYAWKSLPYNHAVWHLFVMAGSISHFFAVLLHVLPGAPGPAGP